MAGMTTSDDRPPVVLHALLQLCRESLKGYVLAEREVPDAALWREFEPYRHARERTVHHLEQRLRELRGDPEATPSAAAALHRAWLQLRAAADPQPDRAILAEVLRGERIAVEAFAQARAEADLDPVTRHLLEREYEQVLAAHDRIQQLLNRATTSAS